MTIEQKQITFLSLTPPTAVEGAKMSSDCKPDQTKSSKSVSHVRSIECSWQLSTKIASSQLVCLELSDTLDSPSVTVAFCVLSVENDVTLEVF